MRIGLDKSSALQRPTTRWFVISACAGLFAVATIAVPLLPERWTLPFVASLVFLLIMFAIQFDPYRIYLIFVVLLPWEVVTRIDANLTALIPVGAAVITTLLAGIVMRTTRYRVLSVDRWILLMSAVIAGATITGTDLDNSIPFTRTFLFLLMMLWAQVHLLTSVSRIRQTLLFLAISTAVIAITMMLSALDIYSFPFMLDNQVVYGISRLRGAYLDANYAAFSLSLGLFASACLLLRVRRPIPLIGLSVAAVITLGALLATQSIGGILGVFVGASLLLIATNPSPGSRLLRVVAIVLAAISVVAFAPDTFQARFSQNLDWLAEDSLMAGDGRVSAWLAAGQAILGRPILGYGPGNGAYVTASFDALTTIRANDVLAAHNTPLAIGVDLGVVGMLLAGAMLFEVSRHFLIIFRKSSVVDHDVQWGMVGLAVACLIQSLALDLQATKGLWLVVGLLFAYVGDKNVGYSDDLVITKRSNQSSLGRSHA